MTIVDAEYLKKLNDIGIALSAEHDIEKLLEMILQKAKSIANADAGILFTRHETEKALIQRVRHCDSLNIHVGGTTGEPTYGRPVELYDLAGKPHHESVTSHCALSRKSVNIQDVSTHTEFDFSSTKEFDRRRNYHTQSVLAVPMVNKRNEVLGVIRLSNAQDVGGNVIPFSPSVQHMVESLASQGAVALDNDLLIKGLEDLLEALIQIVAKAIDQKSPHTGNHLQKVPIITEMLAKEACASSEPAFKSFDLTEEEMYEVRIAAWLHDCGKLTTPDYILEKGRKLQTFCDRIDMVRTRFEVVKRDAEIRYLKALTQNPEEKGSLLEKYEDEVQSLEDDWCFLDELNQGAEWVDDEKLARLDELSKRVWSPTIGLSNDEVKECSFFSDEELENLQVRRGTLTASDRKIIQDHILHSIDMLERLPFPRQLARVPEYAGGHHEKVNGKGYPKGLKGEQMSIPARMMAVADIFEALTSHDRPYKTPKTLSETYSIMKKMCDDGDIDRDIFDLLWKTDLHKRYAKQFLLPQQWDEIPA